jgi:transglutaminase-like putative cysteine protease
MFLPAPNLLFALAILASGLADGHPVLTALELPCFGLGLYLTHRRGFSLSARMETLLALAAAGLAFLLVAASGDLVLNAFRHWLTFLLVIRSFRRLGKREYGVGFLIVGGLLIHVSKVHHDLSFLVIALGFAALLPHALFDFLSTYGGFQEMTLPASARHRTPSGPRFLHLAGVSAALVVVSTILFLAMPRPRSGSLAGSMTGQNAGQSGLSDSVELGAFNRIVQLNDIIMTVRTDRPSSWRAKVLDQYRDGTWRQTAPTDLSLYRADEQEGTVTVREFEIFDLRQVSHNLCASGNFASVEPLGTPWRIRHQPIYSTLDLLYSPQGATRGRYRLTSREGTFLGPRQLGIRPVVEYGGIGNLDEEKLFLETPPDLANRIHELAQDLTRGIPTVEGKVLAVERHLSEGFEYSLEGLSSGGREPLDHFLFESRTGHCEYFATAMAILLRRAGVHTRVVQGFTPGAFLDDRYVVRLSDAHLWCEVFYPGKGWRAHDPTPGGETRGQASLEVGWFERMRLKWYTSVLQYDGTTRSELGAALGAWVAGVAGAVGRFLSRHGGLLLLLPGGLLLGLVLHRLHRRHGLRLPDWARWRRGPRASRAHHAFARYLRELQRRGYRRDPGTTPNELLSRLRGDGVPVLKEAEWLTALFYATRFGARAPGPDEEQRMRKALRTVRAWARG